MAKPVILAVDDEPEVRRAVERDLRSQYGKEYRVMTAGGGREGVELVHKLKARGSDVALFVADQRMPQMTGTEFLTEVKDLYPDARKVLLTAYADTEAAIESINTIGLDHYLKKPWDPPEDKLFPVLDDLIETWLTTVKPAYEGIRVAGTVWSSHDAKEFLARNQIPYKFLDIERDEAARKMVESASPDGKLPVVFLPDGKALIAPSRTALAETAGLQTTANNPYYDLIVLGAGPAGLAAGVYGGSEGLRTAVVEKKAPGGQAGTSSRIENYLGFPKGLSGDDLAHRATMQAKRFGVEILSAEATAVRSKDGYHTVTLGDGSEISCQSLIVATGVDTRQLTQPGCGKLAGRGVYYGASLTEAATFKDQEIYIVGGANSAGQAAVFFSDHASKVNMLVRGDGLVKSMSHYLIEKIEGIENIEVLTRTEILEACGERKLETLTLSNRDTNERRQVDAAAVFVFIGAVPHTGVLADLVELDEAGFVKTGQDLIVDGKPPRGWRPERDPFLLEASVPGVFAAGDVRAGSMKRVASAVGEGANAVAQVHQYLKTV